MNQNIYKTNHFTRDVHDKIINRHSLLSGDEMIFSLLEPDFLVIDVGCGTGGPTFSIAEKLSDEGCIIGIDNSRETINNAIVTATNKRTGNIQFIHGDASDLPFSCSYFDIAYCRHLLMHMEKCSDIIQELKRVVKNGGWVVAIEGDFETFKYYPVFKGWELYMDFVRSNIASPNAGRQLWKLFHDIGFLEITIRAIPFVATGNIFKEYVMSWIKALEGYSDFLIKTEMSDKETISSILFEGQQLYDTPNGFFCSVEYEITGKK
jgi:ubiquinone/menaquinone biosynthesis C-methylase UbiE